MVLKHILIFTSIVFIIYYSILLLHLFGPKLRSTCKRPMDFLLAALSIIYHTGCTRDYVQHALRLFLNDIKIAIATFIYPVPILLIPFCFLLHDTLYVIDNLLSSLHSPVLWLRTPSHFETRRLILWRPHWLIRRQLLILHLTFVSIAFSFVNQGVHKLVHSYGSNIVLFWRRWRTGRR